jgi:serine/threonine protein kinase
MNNHNGKYFGRYQVIEQLGRGGMATVYKGFDPQLERSVAIKVILQREDHSETFLARFKREAKTLARLSHPNIVKVLDYGEQEGLPFLVMDYIAGGSLATGIQRPVHWRKAAELLLPVARALHEAHHQGIVHRDVKPSNILLSDSGMPMLSDFGIAKMLEYHETLDLTQNGVGIGTPEYMAPEQGTGEGADYRVDIYALGVVFYELVTGNRPYTADTPLAVLLKHHNQPLPSPRNYAPDLPDDVERFIYKLMAKDPNQRYSDMGAVAAMLEKLASGAGLTRIEAPIITQIVVEESASDSSLKATFPPKNMRWAPLAASFGALILLCVIGLTALYIIRRSQPPKIITITGGVESATPAEDFASVNEVSGLVEVVSADGVAVPVEERTNLRVGGTFHLKSTDGQARLTLVDGSTICIPPNSEVEFLSNSSGSDGQKNMRLGLVAGSLLFVDRVGENTSFQIERPIRVAVGSQGAVIGLGKKSPGSAVLDLDCLAGVCSFESQARRVELENPGSTQLGSDGNFSSVSLLQVNRWANLCADVIGKRVAGVPTPTRDNNIINIFNNLVAPKEQPKPTPRLLLPTSTQPALPLPKSPTPKPPIKTARPATITPSPQPSATIPGDISPTVELSPTDDLSASPTAPSITTQAITPQPTTGASPTAESLLPATPTLAQPTQLPPTVQPTASQPQPTTDIPAPTEAPILPPYPPPQPTDIPIPPTRPTETPAA